MCARRARRGLASAARFPTLDARAGAGHTRTEDADTTLYAARFDASWEVDVFGGQRRNLEAATATLQARAEELHDVLVTLTSEVALNYLEARVAAARLATATANLRTQVETHEIATFRFQAGLTTQIDVEQARTALERTRAALPELRAQRAQAVNRLAVLLGQPPGTLTAELATARPIPVAPVAIAIGLPADVLRRRPDVRRAERELAAQTAQVGAAMAEPYPRLTLTGSIGLEALALGDLLSTAAPVLFPIAEDLPQMDLELEIDEADVGQVRPGQPATFTVDAYPDRRFEATVAEVRFASETVEGVVTYKAILHVDNDDLALRPGMTATADLEVRKLTAALLVPNAAPRFVSDSAQRRSESGGGSLVSRLLPRPSRSAPAPRARSGRA